MKLISYMPRWSRGRVTINNKRWALLRPFYAALPITLFSAVVSSLTHCVSAFLVAFFPSARSLNRLGGYPSSSHSIFIKFADE